MALSMAWAVQPATWHRAHDMSLSPLPLSPGTYWSIDRQDETATIWFTQHVDMSPGLTVAHLLENIGNMLVIASCKCLADGLGL